MASDTLDSAGKLIFRLRSVAPVAVIVAVFILSWRGHSVPLPYDEALNFAGLALAIIGQVIRVVTIASVPRNTSLQSRRMQATTINTTGPYAVVRHPLYFGNYLITLGMLCIAHAPWFWAMGLAYLFASQLLIARSEDRLLREKFGDEWVKWAAEVRALWPRLSYLKDVRGPFEWKRAVQREINPFVGWTVGAALLFWWELFARWELTRAQIVGLRAFVIAMLVLLVANKVWKKVSPA